MIYNHIEEIRNEVKIKKTSQKTTKYFKDNPFTGTPLPVIIIMVMIHKYDSIFYMIMISLKVYNYVKSQCHAPYVLSV